MKQHDVTRNKDGAGVTLGHNINSNNNNPDEERLTMRISLRPNMHHDSTCDCELLNLHEDEIIRTPKTTLRTAEPH